MYLLQLFLAANRPALYREIASYVAGNVPRILRDTNGPSDTSAACPASRTTFHVILCIVAACVLTSGTDTPDGPGNTTDSPTNQPSRPQPPAPHGDAQLQQPLTDLEERLVPIAAAWAPGEVNIQAYAAWLAECIDHLLTAFNRRPLADLGASMPHEAAHAHRGRIMVEMCMRIWERTKARRATTLAAISALQGTDRVTYLLTLLIDFYNDRGRMTTKPGDTVPIPDYMHNAQALLNQTLWVSQPSNAPPQHAPWHPAQHTCYGQCSRRRVSP